ncbi:UNKNOWN [Stylonychia lemnae]|uniref:Uncharacterized protein n=1 Tax=Stylonychia lemnae TaxID=5949 RepID=A0A078AZH7_STYLE|nr:UNKNOWN [Stylonychia lemnae]|eukprot:CDW86213.1 UNKNOWN [Stylonychia lemnae]
MLNTADGTMKFRRVVLVFSIVFATITMLILISDTPDCERLRLGLWMAFSIHFTSFLLLLFHFIGLGFILKKLGRILGIYYFYMVGAMFYTQIIFFQSKECNIMAPLLYFWVMLNIIMFYVLVAYGIALWGAYICWESEKEEKQLQEAMQKYIKKISHREKNNPLMVDLEKSSGKKLLKEEGEKKKKKKKQQKQKQLAIAGEVNELD